MPSTLGALGRPFRAIVRIAGKRMTMRPAAKRMPRSGCVRIEVHVYAVRSFKEQSFAREPLAIWLPTAA
jgi:hypothetical protein